MSDFEALKAELEKINAEEAEELKALEIPPDHKYCTKCGELRPFEMFAKASNHKDGLQYWCKPCVRTYQRQRATGRESVLSELLSFPTGNAKLLIDNGRYTTREIRSALEDALAALREIGFGGDAGSTRGD
jgi:transposase-like protein